LLLQIIIELGYLYFFTKRKYPEVTWKDFGLRPFDKVSAFEFALLLLVFIWIAETAFMYYLDQVEANTAVDSQVKSYLFGGIAPTWVLVVFGTLIAPFVEELVFRGFLLSALIPELQKWFKNLNHKIFSDHHWYKTFGYWTGIFISSALFTGAHLQWLPVPLYFMMGVILSVLFVHSKSLWPGIIFHMINNGVAFGIMFYQYHFG
jgi:membrane protease YdiL (CAAX protease family)